MLALMLAVCLAAPDVFFVSVDTLRADHLGCYGYPLPTSPHIDALADASLVFDGVVCEVPLTAPSFCSMLTSQFPRVTGTTRNGLRLPESVPTVAEQFQAAGYQTFCVQSNWTLKTDLSGLGRGFDVYEDRFHKRRWGIIKSERDADEVTRIARELLDKRTPDKPVFAWIHYSDPHAPYKYHREYDPRKKADREALAKLNEAAWERPRRRVAKRYGSEIRFTDHHIGELLEALPKDAVVLFVADHGESLYEHNYLGHGRRIYQTGIHVPLTIKAPGVDPGRSDAPIRGIDVGPTLLALAGIAAPPAMMGRNVLDPAFPLDRPRVIETYGGAVPKLWGAKALMADAPPQWQGVLYNGWKLILGASQAQLYYLPDDPLELTDKAAEEPEHVRKLTALVRQWDSATEKTSGDAVDLTDDDRRALDNLGYLE